MAVQLSAAPRGLTFARYIKSITVAKGDVIGALGFAMGQNWGNTPGVIETLKAAVNPLVTSDEGAALVTPASFDLSEFLRVRTLLGRLQGLRRVPFATKMLSTASGTTASWVGESAPGALSAMDFDAGVTLGYSKLLSIAAITQELARTPNAHAEMTIAADVGRAISEAADKAFVAADNVGVTGVKPASVTSAGTGFVSSGSALANVDADLKLLIAHLTDSNVSLDNAAWMMPSRTATSLALLRGSGGALAFPSMSDKDRRLCGLPVLTSNACMDVSSPTEAVITLLAADEVDLADDGAATLDYSEHASMAMDNAPANAAAQQVSFWAHGLVGIRAVRTVNWALRRSTACAYLTGVTY